MFLTLLQSQGGPTPIEVIDTSDILDRNLRRSLTTKEEENIAAQLLLKRRGKKQPEEVKKQIDWQKLILDQINGASTEEELDAISIPVESTDITAKVLAEIERQKEAKRIALEILRKEAELKASELEAELRANESAIIAKINEQRIALESARQLQLQILERHKIAVAAAMELEMQAAAQAAEAERKAAEFTRQRELKIKRLKALMWLTKLDL